MKRGALVCLIIVIIWAIFMVCAGQVQNQERPLTKKVYVVLNGTHDQLHIAVDPWLVEIIPGKTPNHIEWIIDDSGLADGDRIAINATTEIKEVEVNTQDKPCGNVEFPPRIAQQPNRFIHGPFATPTQDQYGNFAACKYNIVIHLTGNRMITIDPDYRVGPGSGP